MMNENPLEMLIMSISDMANTCTDTKSVMPYGRICGAEAAVKPTENDATGTGGQHWRM